VGAVLVNDGQIVGEGYHRYDLLKHAETHALEMAGPLARGATLYCNLEPCCHYGRTPPCTDALVAAGIARAVIAMLDPNPRVNGGGADILRRSGIAVEVGLCEAEAARLNEIYLKHIQTGLPFAHAVIGWPMTGETGPTDFLKDWTPSAEFLQDASQYDALLAGDYPKISALINEACEKRSRHEALLVADLNPSLQLIHELRALAGSRVTSVIISPLRSNAFILENLESLDKLTVVLPGPIRREALESLTSLGPAAYEQNAEQRAADSGFTELIIYPQRK
ncbi:MAG TPA: bifunctional diaminohydroxyphosphoribosylaminopyrimidine deaminase/5-amino-6-(5-phosphoribosylamino)uracil reductase RibD, partial [Blastocatellia bacterium]|nr:bifunctional diaminohydroxyphosphoribosylaminopyrimidine deaminase/5-amino-6-(5-phosphoribosylamino)uracil reductase RibD [Blastocatellia bacterium]